MVRSNEFAQRIPFLYVLFVCLVPLPVAGLPEASDLHFARLTVDEGPAQIKANAFLQDRLGFLWLATDDGLYRYDGHRLRSFRPAPDDGGSPPGDAVLALGQDNAGQLWIGTSGGLRRFDPVTERFVRSIDPKAGVSTIYEDAAGSLWIGTTGDGLGRYDPLAEELFHYRHEPGNEGSIADDHITALLEDRDGHLWIGTTNGLDCLDAARLKPLHFRFDENDPASLGHNRISALYEDRGGVLWIGTAGGLERHDAESGGFVHVTTEPVMALAGDGGGQLWIAGPHRLDRIDAEGRNGPVQALFEDRAGRLWIATPTGVEHFDPRPAEADAESFDGRIVLTGFKLFGDEIDFGRAVPYLEEIELTAGQNFFTFEFSALNYGRPATRYAYRLEGFDREWIEAGTRRDARYTNVPSGSYVFRVRPAAGGEGTQVRLTVAPPLWKSWWARALYTLVLAAAVGLIASRVQARRWRHDAASQREQFLHRQLEELDQLKDGLLIERERLIGELEARNDELMKITYTLAHDLMTPLDAIQDLLDSLRNRERDKDLDGIDRAVGEMSYLVRELFQYSRVVHETTIPEPVDLGELVREAALYAWEGRTNADVELEIGRDLPTVLGDRSQLLELFKVLLDNAVTFVEAGVTPRVQVGNRDHAAQPVIFVRDNGVGIQRQDHDRIFELFGRLDSRRGNAGVGLALARRIVELHGGRIWVESVGDGSGSIFCFTLPAADPEKDGWSRWSG